MEVGFAATVVFPIFLNVIRHRRGSCVGVRTTTATDNFY